MSKCVLGFAKFNYNTRSMCNDCLKLKICKSIIDISISYPLIYSNSILEVFQNSNFPDKLAGCQIGSC